MEQKNDLQLFRLRTSRSIIADGYRLYTNNFRKIFHLSWIAALAFAIVMSVMASLNIELLPLNLMSKIGQGNQTIPGQYETQAIMRYLFMVLSVLAYVLLATMGYQALGQHRQEGTITAPAKWYSLPDMKLYSRFFVAYLLVTFSLIVCLSLPATVCVLLVFGKIGMITGMLAFFVSILLISAILLPLIYSFQKYLFDPHPSLLGIFGRDYLTGWHYWGRIFAVTLIVSIVTTLISILIELPAPILSMAYLVSQQGVVIGDPSGMPEYMGWMKYLVFALAGFVQSFVTLSAFFPLYYLYGSIVVNEEERKQQHKDL